jgi:sigma-54 dependent transcriptional regulator, acetoin dehydrogenase operon transcriptional activator AcoR
MAETHEQPCQVSDEVMGLFKQHHWPGNFRQLTNLLRTAMVRVGDEQEVRREHLPDDFLEDIDAIKRVKAEDTRRLAAAGATSLEEVETALIRKTLEAHGGNVSAAARALGVSRNTIYRKIPPK